jgi:hypothetical protein
MKRWTPDTDDAFSADPKGSWVRYADVQELVTSLAIVILKAPNASSGPLLEVVRVIHAEFAKVDGEK